MRPRVAVGERVLAFSLDSNVMVAAVCPWHEHHRAAAAAIEWRFAHRRKLVTPAHALVEAYAVLTRLPAPHRLAAADAWALVEANFVNGRSIAALAATGHITLLRALAATGVGGGRCYDALIAATAVTGGGAELLTFNPRHFDNGPAELAIVALPESV